jgi:hypothetical protein
VSSCITCNSPNCISCAVNNFCAVCAVGYTPNTISGTCSLCISPCLTCFTNNNTCSSCQPPYYVTPLNNGTCYICNVPNCQVCNSVDPSTCLICNTFYFYNDTSLTCQPNCSANCAACKGTVCSACSTYYYVNATTGACQSCSNTPQCLTCNPTQPTQCLICAPGFYLNNNACSACPVYCSSCNSSSLCNILTSQYAVGYVLVSLSATTNALAPCDPGCLSCSSANPSFCLACSYGFYMNPSANNISSGFCTPCTLSSNCMQCNPSSPATCLNCYPGATLVSNNTCQLCTSNCYTCNINSTSSCTSCPIGFVLSNNACINSTTTNSSCGTNCATCTVVNSTSVCSFCIEGSVLNNGFCVPCQAGCLVCSNSNFSSCITCIVGYYSNSTGGCSSCSQNCISCTSLGCNNCATGWTLASNFKCVPTCVSPCATCLTNAATTCQSCLFGYINNATNIQNCLVNVTTCNANLNCMYCPYGYALVVTASNAAINQTCVACNSNCARCTSSNITFCTSCHSGFYLNNNNVCVACGVGCSSCSSLNICFSCKSGYIAQMQASYLPTSVQPQICMPCLSPCQTCLGAISTCLSCVNSFTLQGTQCVSNFNFQVVCTLTTTPTAFNQNYLAFLNTVASSINSTIDAITVLSINYGSVTVTMLVNSNGIDGSNAASLQQTNIQNALTGTVANMTVQTTKITINGGSSNNNNNNNDSGLSQTTIIILATVIPIGTLCKDIFI